MWYSLNNDDRSDYVKMVTRGFLELSDYYLSLGADDEGVYSFEINTRPTRSLPYINSFQNAVTYEISLDQFRFVRRVQTVLDLVAELGGLWTSISRIFLLFLGMFNYFGSY